MEGIPGQVASQEGVSTQPSWETPNIATLHRESDVAGSSVRPLDHASSVLVVPDHLVQELLGALGLALGRHRRHRRSDGAAHSATRWC